MCNRAHIVFFFVLVMFVLNQSYPSTQTNLRLCPFPDACWSSKRRRPTPRLSLFVFFPVSIFLRQKLRISMAGVGGWGQQDWGSFFHSPLIDVNSSFDPN